MDNTPYQYGFYDGKSARLIAFYQADDDCDSTIPAHTDRGGTTEGVITAGIITALQVGGK